MAGEPVNERHLSKFDLGSGYLRCSDLLVGGEFKTFELTISHFHPALSLKGSDGKPVKHPCLAFKEAKKIMVLNATSQEILHLVTGESDGALTVGHKVLIEARVVEAFGETCLGIRIMPRSNTLLRKGVRKFLGKKAIWEGQAAPKDEKPVE